MFPLTFDEYIDMKAFLGKSISQDITEEFDTYLREGGFPKAIQYDSTEDRRTYIKGIVTEIFEKDIKRRVKISLPNHPQSAALIVIFHHLSPMGRNLFRYLYDFFCVFHR